MRLLPSLLPTDQQRRLMAEVRLILDRAPLYTPAMPRLGQSLVGPHVQLRAAGLAVGAQRLPLQPDPSGHRRALARDPARWCSSSGTRRPGSPIAPEACLINYYGPTAKLGLHRDQDEDAKEAPILSISLGDTALFRLGGPERKSPTRSVRLSSGDVVCSRARRGTGSTASTASCPAPAGSCPRAAGINLTLRRVTAYAERLPRRAHARCWLPVAARRAALGDGDHGGAQQAAGQQVARDHLLHDGAGWEPTGPRSPSSPDGSRH